MFDMRIKGTHFIDTCVFLESLDKKGRKRKECEKYLNKVGKVCNGVLSVEILGEFLKFALTKSYTDYLDLMDWFLTTIKAKNIKIIIPSFKAFEKFEEINKLNNDPRLGTMDRLHLACAEVSKSVDSFITIERTITNAKSLREGLKIKLKEPRDFT